MKKTVTIISLSLLLLGCSLNEERTSQGYIEGLLTYISSSSSGYLDVLSVDRGYQVIQGSPLFTLTLQPDNHAYDAALQDLQQAKGNKADIDAKLQFAKVTLVRNKDLYKKGFVQKATLDQSQSDYDSLMAQQVEATSTINQKTAQLASNAWTMSQKNITAPKKGVVFDRYYRVGEYVASNQPVLSILSKDDIKIIFYVYQSDLSLLQLGKKVNTACDGDKWESATISFISPQAEFTPPLIFSNSTNAKLVFRIEARYASDQNVRCHPGQPVTVKYGSK